MVATVSAPKRPFGGEFSLQSRLPLPHDADWAVAAAATAIALITGAVAGLYASLDRLRSGRFGSKTGLNVLLSVGLKFHDFVLKGIPDFLKELDFSLMARPACL